MHHPRTGALVRVTTLALLWGSGFLWTRLALDGGLTPAYLATLRCALGAAVLLVLARAARQTLPRDRRTWRHLAVAALLCNALPFLLTSIGQQSVDSGVAGVLHATTPLWSLLLALTVGSEHRPHPARLAGLLLGFAGTLLIFAPGPHSRLDPAGVTALLAAAASYALAYAYMARHLTGRDAPLAHSAAQLLAATGLTALALPAATPPTAPTATGLTAAIILGTLATGVTFHLNARLIATEGPTTAAAVGYLLPAVAVTLGAAVLDEPLTGRTVTGTAVVLAGVALTRRRPRPADPPTPRPAGARPPERHPARR
ncbi:DMT family transporter [Micromonospora globbae]|uniref:DMT family transporter n=1 Tax=Micromonospora globbae TaxID=1894969 RepID=UPI00344AEE19